MGLSVSASRGAGDRAGTITLMCLALMFQALFLVTAARNRLRAPAHPLGAGVRAIAFFFAVAVLLVVAFLERFGAPISLSAGGQLTGREGADVVDL